MWINRHLYSRYAKSELKRSQPAWQVVRFETKRIQLADSNVLSVQDLNSVLAACTSIELRE